VIANRLVSAQETLVVAAEVRRSLVDLVARHAAAVEDGRQRRAAEEARRVAAATAESRRLTEELGRLREASESAKTRLESRHRSRSNRIREAERRVRKLGLERAEAEEGRSKFALQRDLLKAAREKDAEWVAADSTLAERQSRLVELANELARREREVDAVFHLGNDGVRRLSDSASPASPTTAGRGLDELLSELTATLSSVAGDVATHRRRGMSRLTRAWPVWLTLILVPLPMVPVLEMAGVPGFSLAIGAGVSGAALILGVILFALAKYLAGPAARRAALHLAQARLLHQAASAECVAAHALERERVQTIHASIAEQGESAWQLALDRATWARTELPVQAEARARTALQRNARLQEAAFQRLEAWRTEQAAMLQQTSMDRLAEWQKGHEERLEELAARGRGDLEGLRQEWSAQIDRLAGVRRSAEAHPDAALAPAWTQSGWDQWNPPDPFVRAARFGWLHADPCRMAGLEAGHPLVDPSGSEVRELPLLLCYPESGSMVFESRDPATREEALVALNQVILRLLGSAPPGKLAVTLFDPVGLGQGFAGLMHLADEAEHLISGRIWTQTPQIEARLAELNDHLEKVIQMYLRNEYATLAEYNEQAGDVAERYHFLVVTDFPSGFSDLAVKRLAAIANAGPRCGVHLLVHWDQRQPLPADFPADLMRSRDLRVAWSGKAVTLNGQLIPGATIHLEPPPPPEVLTPFIQRVARLGVHSNRVEVPFAYVAPRETDRWSVSTQSEVRVAIGRTRATRQQYLSLGRGTRQHVLVAGKTGSGKSTLLHVVITNLALWCRPDEVEFYLVDFKKGVEFKCYAAHRLPHARVVAIESDREFGLSVLQRVDAELRRRGEIFRDAGVQDVAGFREIRPGQAMPRVLLIIDEFQEFFVEEDRVAQDASLLLDRIVRQGRAFGVHVILGSQTLGGAYTVARSTMGQMAVRIALQCNEADAYLIMDETNAAPRLLSRPGEGIYNDAAGAKEGNSPFQVVWLPDAVRDSMLKQVRAQADHSGQLWDGPLVFEGNSPANLAENRALGELLATEPPPNLEGLKFWLGAPNAIKGPSEVALTSRGGDHVLMVGQRTEALEAFRVGLILAMAAQNTADRLRCVVLQGRPTESPEAAALESILRRLPLRLEFAGPAELESVLTALAEDLASRNVEGGGPGPTTVLLVDGIQNFKKLRQEDEFSFGADAAANQAPARLKELVMEGSTSGIHVVVTCDTYGNVLRYLGRKALAEFGFRVLHQMSATDSASLMDGPEASRLGVYRAVLHEEREGNHEVFRPYSLPPATWVEAVTRNLADRRGFKMATTL
jgi:S-DNA-T family DNA segregation ATPase FtsK/SpoIIIE